MTGSGTKDSPYIPENWDEFVEAVKKDRAYVSMPEGGGVFDMNDIKPEGGITVAINCNTIDGNDWEIRNAHNELFSASSGTNTRVINRLHILNFYIDSGSLGNITRAALNNCNLSGVIAGSSLALYGGTYNYCSMNFKFIDEAFQIAYYNNQEFNFVNAVIDHSDSKMKSSASFNTINANNSFFEHRSSAEKGKIKLHSSSKSSVVHSDAGSFVVTSTGSTVDVTEEQLRDAAYLNSIGFPIAGD